MADVSKADVYGEIMQSTRHYSSLRFVMMPVYITVTGALAVAAHTVQFAAGTAPIKAWFWAAGLLTSVVFLLFEIALSYNLSCLWRAAAALAGDVVPGAFAHRRAGLLWAVRVTWIAIYLGGVAFWLFNRV